MTITTEFLLTSLIVVLLPGTGVIYTLSIGIAHGTKASVFAAVGCTAGIIPHLFASIFGVAAILHTSAVAFQMFKAIGVLYLAYLAWAMWKESGALEISSTKQSSLFKIAARGLFINVLNPKLSIFFLAFLPQFVSANSADMLFQLLTLSGVFMLMTLLVFIGYGILATQVRHLVGNSPHVVGKMNKLFSGLFVALGVKLALSER